MTQANPRRCKARKGFASRGKPQAKPPKGHVSKEKATHAKAKKGTNMPKAGQAKGNHGKAMQAMGSHGQGEEWPRKPFLMPSSNLL